MDGQYETTPPIPSNPEARIALLEYALVDLRSRVESRKTTDSGKSYITTIAAVIAAGASLYAVYLLRSK